MARRSSPRRSYRRVARKSSPRRSSGRKLNKYAAYVKKHYSAAKKAVGKGAKSTTVFKKIATMYKKTHKHSGRKHSGRKHSGRKHSGRKH